MFDAVAPRYDIINRIMSLGMDMNWRYVLVSSLEVSLPLACVRDDGFGTGLMVMGIILM